MRNSEGVIEKRGRNRFRSRITIRGRAYSKTFSQLAQAEQWLLDLQLSTDEDDLTHRLHTEQLSVRELIERFRDEVAKRRSSPESRRREVARCNHLLAQNPEMADMRAVNLQPRHIVSYIARRRLQGASDGTIRAELAIVRRTFTLAGGAWGLGLDQPVRPSSMPPPPPARERRLQPGEYDALMRAAHTYENQLGGPDRIPIGAVIETAIATAMRRNELATLTWDRIEIFADGFGMATLPQLRTKTRKTRHVPLTPDLLLILLSVPSAEARVGPVFAASQSAIGLAWHRVLKLAGLHVPMAEQREMKRKAPRNDHGLRLHDLRHEGTTRFFEIYGMPKALVQAITGHSSEAMADRYTHLEARPMIMKIMRNAHGYPDVTARDALQQAQAHLAGTANHSQSTRKPVEIRHVNARWKHLRRDAAQ
jgi:integrase